MRLVTASSLAGAALAFGLSFGLGSRSLVGDILAGLQVKGLFSAGSQVEAQGHRGMAFRLKGRATSGSGPVREFCSLDVTFPLPAGPNRRHEWPHTEETT